MIQDAPSYVIVYRPRFMLPGRWFAWVARDPADAKKPAWARKLDWWPVSEDAALAWFGGSLPPRPVVLPVAEGTSLFLKEGQ